MSEDVTFVGSLRDEIIATVRSRTEVAREKVKFTYTLMGIGSATTLIQSKYAYLLYLVPVVAVAFDLVYFRECYSVQRIGRFLRSHSPIYTERQFEGFVQKNRTSMEDVSQVFLNIATVLSSLLMVVILGSQESGQEQSETSWFILIPWMFLMLYLSGLPYSFYIYGKYRLEYKNFNCPACGACGDRQATEKLVQKLTFFSLTWLWLIVGGLRKAKKRCASCTKCFAGCHRISSGSPSDTDYCI